MHEWITVKNVPYDTAVTRFTWSSEIGLVVRFDKWKDADVSTMCYSGVPKSLFKELKKEVTSNERCVNNNYWFLHGVKSSKSIKQNIKAETDSKDISARPVH
jgi:hypothetical protein